VPWLRLEQGISQIQVTSATTTANMLSLTFWELDLQVPGHQWSDIFISNMSGAYLGKADCEDANLNELV
jgi:hypothetical protein